VPPAGGRFPIEVAAPWPFTAALLDLPARRRAMALEDLRSVRVHERKAHVRATLLTLAPTFPTRSGPCDPAANRVSSRGVVQRSPLHRSSRGVRFPEAPASPQGRSSRRRAARFLLRDGNAVPIRVPSSWSLTTSTVCSSSTPQPFSGCCRSWGSPRFLLSRNRISRSAPAALRSVPSADSCGRRNEFRPSAGPRHHADRRRPSRSPRPLPPRR